MSLELPDEVLLMIFSYLPAKDLFHCASVCRRWKCISGRDTLWRNVHRLTVSGMATVKPPEIFTALARQTSWKFVFKCSIVLQYKSSPHFWDDISLFLDLQSSRTAMNSWCACNGLFWLMLQLKLGPTGITSPLARPNPSQSSLTQLQYSLPVLIRHYGVALVLQKLKEVAMLPSASYLSSPSPRITSSVLFQLRHDCLVSDLTAAGHPPWPSPTSSYLNWESCFTQPVQDTVITALRSWMAIAGQREWRCTVAGKPTVSWLNQLAGEKFWVNNRSKLVTAIAEGASVRACSQRYLYSSISVPELDFILDKNVTPRLAAERLCRWSYDHLHNLPTMDLIHYLVSEQPEFTQLPLNRLLARYQDKLARTVALHCMSAVTLKKKVIAVHRVLDICVQLRELRDLMTLKALWAAVGTVVAQQHLTPLSWNDIRFKDCERFGELRELLSHKNCYTTYLRYVRELQYRSFVPYLPAHRQFCQQWLLHSTSVDSASLPGRSATMGRSECQSALVISYRAGGQHSWMGSARASGIRPCDLLSVEHVLMYGL